HRLHALHRPARIAAAREQGLAAERLFELRQQHALFGLGADAQTQILTIRAEVGEQAGRVFVEMQHQPPLPIEQLALLLLQPCKLADFRQQRLEDVQRLRPCVSHAAASMNLASSTSRSLKPPQSWVDSVTSTRL